MTRLTYKSTDRGALDATLTAIQEETLAEMKQAIPHSALLIGGPGSETVRMSARRMRRFFAKTQRQIGRKDGRGRVRR
jgi:hypothetical protein